MSAIRSTAPGILAKTIDGFTLCAWVRPYESGRLQRVLTLGVNGTATPLFSLAFDASDNLILTNSVGPTSTTIMAAAEWNQYRLYCVLVSYRKGTLYYRVSSKLVLSSGTTAWPAALTFSTANRCSIGSLHDNVATDRFNGHLFGLYMTTEYLGDVRDSAVYDIFERDSGELAGFPVNIAPTTPSGLTPAIHFGFNQAAAAWNAGTNRGSVVFGAAEGAAVTGIGISQRLAVSTPYVDQPYEADGTYIYTMHNGQRISRVPLASRGDTPTTIVDGISGTPPAFKREDGTTPLTGNAGYYELYKTASGWLLQVMETTTNIRRFYRSTDIASWTGGSLTPVVTLGSDGTTGINGSLYAGRTTLRKSTFIQGTFNGAPALYLGEYSAASGTPVLPGTIWYSVDDGASWAPFWRFQNYYATDGGNRKWRYVHGVVQCSNGDIAAIMNSNNAGEHSIIIGPSTTTWAAIADLTVAGIEAVGAPYTVVRGSDAQRWIQAVDRSGWIIGGNETTATGHPLSAMYAVRNDGTDITLTHQRANMISPNEAHAGGGIYDWNGLLVSLDYVGPSATTPSDTIEVRTSRDGFFWVPVGVFDLMETRANLTHHWGIFEAGSDLVLAGNNQQYMATGTQALTAVVSLGDETGADEELTVLNLAS